MVQRNSKGRFVKGFILSEKEKEEKREQQNLFWNSDKGSELRNKLSMKNSGKNNPFFGKNHTQEFKDKHNQNFRDDYIGENNPNWNGGYHKKYQRKRMTADYKKWRDSVFKRDNYECQFCHDRGVFLESHHIKRVKDYPNLYFDINNGITLCKDCHQQTKFHESSYGLLCDWILETKQNIQAEACGGT